MKLWKKIAITLFVIILLVQIPFIYNRYKFGQLAGVIKTLESQRIETPNTSFNEPAL